MNMTPKSNEFYIDLVEVFDNSEVVGYIVSKSVVNGGYFGSYLFGDERFKNLNQGMFITKDYLELLRSCDPSVYSTTQKLVAMGDIPYDEYLKDRQRCYDEDGEFVSFDEEIYFRKKYDNAAAKYEHLTTKIGDIKVNVIPESFYLKSPSKFISCILGKKPGQSNANLVGICTLNGTGVVLDELNNCVADGELKECKLTNEHPDTIRFIRINHNYVNGASYVKETYEKIFTLKMEDAVEKEKEIRAAVRGLIRSVVSPVAEDVTINKMIGNIMSEMNIRTDNLKKGDAYREIFKMKSKIESIIAECLREKGSE